MISRSAATASLLSPMVVAAAAQQAPVGRAHAFRSKVDVVRTDVFVTLNVEDFEVKRVFSTRVPVVLGTDIGFFGLFISVSTQTSLRAAGGGRSCPADALSAARGQKTNLGTLETGQRGRPRDPRRRPLADIRDVTRIHRMLTSGVPSEPVDSAVTIRRVLPPGRIPQ